MLHVYISMCMGPQCICKHVYVCCTYATCICKHMCMGFNVYVSTVCMLRVYVNMCMGPQCPYVDMRIHACKYVYACVAMCVDLCLIVCICACVCTSVKFSNHCGKLD